MTDNSMSDDVVERVARAIAIPQHHTTWDILSEEEKNLFRFQAWYAIAALSPPTEQPVVNQGEVERLRELLTACAAAHWRRRNTGG